MALEGLVARHLRAWVAYRGTEERLYYARTKAGSEVDFVLYGPNEFVALEIKRVVRVHGRDLRELKDFQADYQEARIGVLYLGEDQLKTDRVRIIPCAQSLLNLTTTGLFL